MAEKMDDINKAKAAKDAEAERLRKLEILARKSRKKEVVAEEDPFPAEYTVASGDSLSAIAQKFYDDANQWPAIWKANKETIGDDPNRIRPGQVLTIPKI